MPTIRRRDAGEATLEGFHPVLARVLAARGITDPDELDPALARLHRPDLVDLERALERLARAYDRNESILIVGDFDADGATSVALTVRALRGFGYERVAYIVPNRFQSGYGLTAALVEIAAEQRPDLLLTVDNGIAAHDGVEAARQRGIDTVITDHHLPGASLPQAVAVVDPNRGDCAFPSGHLAGVGVAFYLMSALRTHLERSGRFDSAAGRPRAVTDLLDLVALGTVADVVALDRNNRILVEQGLRRLRSGRGQPGVRALLETAKREPNVVTAGDLGYAVAPRLNAAGRLGDMGEGIEALLTDAPAEARRRAQRLDELNQQRRQIETEMRAQAENELERLRGELDSPTNLPAGITLHDPRWHEGVIGIVAGRVRESVNRPTAAFATTEDGYLKGSVRAVPGLHVRDALARIAAAQPGLIERFGGHAQAAGLTIPADRLEAFRSAFAASVAEGLGTNAAEPEVVSDGALAPGELTLATAEALRSRRVGGEHLKMAVVPDDGTQPIEAMWFRAGDRDGPSGGERVRLVYRLEANAFQGRRRVQLVIDHLHPLD
ncbi:MAG: single-stranded-DNA-specific exonuclease RecJ [Proteobacteria bacterium SW_6_67_9]|nr:MAG: single-stranded-DNA-specific exonuclease RecJ [Proteobacteria bacterium SW_6_67_9]